MSNPVINKTYEDKERWICIYPAYINNKKTVKQGRRIPKNKAVENPTCNEMMEVLVNAGLNGYCEPKSYCRERSKELTYQGRIRVQLKNVDGTFYNTSFESRESIMMQISSAIPKLKSRVNKAGSDRSETSKKKGKGRK